MDERSEAGALEPDHLAELLAQAGGTAVSGDDIRADIAAGAPVTALGRVPLVAYVRWLLLRMVHGR